MKLTILQIWDHVYFEVHEFLTKKQAEDFSDEIILYFYSLPKEKDIFLINIGKIMKKYKLKDKSLREYILKAYRTFYRL